MIKLGKLDSPQPERGKLFLANELVDAFAKTRISGQEWQCLWVVIRKTYGWRDKRTGQPKKEDRIPLSQFMLATGMSRSSVCRAIKKLIAKRILVASHQKETGGITKYSLNKQLHTWQPLSKKRQVVSKLIIGSDQIDNPLVTKKRHSKNNHSKNNNNNPPISPLQGEGEDLVKIFEMEYQKRKGHVYIWRSAELRAVARDAKVVSREHWQSAINRFFSLNADRDTFLAQVGYSYTALTHRWNRLLSSNGKVFPYHPTLKELETEKTEREAAWGKYGKPDRIIHVDAGEPVAQGP